jgi:Flp pilus assembly protein TadG
MRWLNGRGRQERGAVAVVVAICMVVLMGFLAIAVDLGSIYSDKQQLQNGADASALAIAESCQRDMSNCTQTVANGVADKYAKANKLDNQSTAKVVLDASHGKVQVETDSTHTNWFAGVLGMQTSAISAHATAAFGYLSGGPSFPLTFSLCQFKLAAGYWNDNGFTVPPTHMVVTLKDQTCTTPATTYVAGGFGWLQGTNCVATVSAGSWVSSDPGTNGANSCTTFDWTTVLGHPILVPIFSNYRASGKNAEYQIIGVAAFSITAYCFGPGAQYPANLADCPNTKRIEGNFTNYTVLTSDYTIDTSAAHFGTGVASLTA